MIVDCHTHIWSDAAQLGDGAEAYLTRQGCGEDFSAHPDDHAAAAESWDTAADTWERTCPTI